MGSGWQSAWQNVAWVHLAFAASYAGVATVGFWDAGSYMWDQAFLRVAFFLLTVGAAVSTVMATLHGLRSSAVTQSVFVALAYAVVATTVLLRDDDPDDDWRQRRMAAFSFALFTSVSAFGLLPVVLLGSVSSSVLSSPSLPVSEAAEDRETRLPRSTLACLVIAAIGAGMVVASQVLGVPAFSCDSLCLADLVLSWLGHGVVPLVAASLYVFQPVRIHQTIAFVLPAVVLMAGWVITAFSSIGGLVSGAGGVPRGVLLTLGSTCVAAAMVWHLMALVKTRSGEGAAGPYEQLRTEEILDVQQLGTAPVLPTRFADGQE